jgi:hypothetical protein
MNAQSAKSGPQFGMTQIHQLKAGLGFKFKSRTVSSELQGSWWDSPFSRL